MITSGVMKENFLRWLIEKKVNITFSADGPPVVQNFHRPLKGGGDSSGIVEKNVKIYRELRGKLHIRATLSKISIQNLNDVLCYWKNIGVTAVSAEPLYPMGRGDNSPFVPEPEETLNALITILEWGRKNRIPIRTSALFYSLPTSNLDLIPCGPLSGNALVVNHQGYLLACGEALDPEHPFWQIWMIGQLKNGKFELDHSRLEELSQMTSVEKIELCKKCFAKYVCRGGCIMRRLFQTGSLAKPDPYHCFVAKNLLINIIIRTVEGKYRFSPNYTV
jgi:radical SAM protein with 4Fe4S-binding SPASM domain